MSHQASRHLKKALDLLDGEGALDDAKKLIREAVRELEHQTLEESGGGRTRGRRFFDRLIERMLEQVKWAESRETLIDDTLHALADDPEARVGLCYLVLEGFVRPDGALIDMAVAAYEAVPPPRMREFAIKSLPMLAGSPLVHDVLIDRETYEFVPTNVVKGISYAGEFDSLLDKSNRNVWICALPLPPADAQRPSRMLVVLYPIIGSDDMPSLPRGAMQEWRTLTFMRAAYEMLNHQLASTSELVEQQRRDILAGLGPGLVNHEINQQLKVIDESSNLINWAVRRLEAYVPADERSFDTVVDGLSNVLKAADRLHRIADAFNNLERRPTQTPISIAQLVDEITTLLNYKIAQVGAQLTSDGDCDVEIVTDASLFEHVLINILVNALESIEAAKDEGPRLPHLRISCSLVEGRVIVEVINNGPSISLSRPERIFEKGFTTKPRGLGHGLGLYLCRIIMTYLGGGIALLDESDLELGFNAGFRLDLPLERKGSDDIASPSTAGGHSKIGMMLKRRLTKE